MKKILTLAFTLMMTISLVGCGTTNSDSDSTRQEQYKIIGRVIDIILAIHGTRVNDTKKDIANWLDKVNAAS